MEFIFVGRLDKEKGIDILIETIKRMVNGEGGMVNGEWLMKDETDQITNSLNHQITKSHFHIIGKGTHSRQIELLAQQSPEIVTYHGRKNKKDIIGLWSRMDYFIMSSTFLETFGLTACESLMLGVPVMGHKKGGLIPFIHNELNLDIQDGDSDSKKLTNLITKLHTHHPTDLTPCINHIQNSYSPEKRYSQIKTLLTNSNILMVSDFVNYDGGGIETHIHDASHILYQQQYYCEIYGHTAPKGKRSKFKKLILMSLSIANLIDSWFIYQKIKKEKIGLIRFHSVSRVIGRLPLFTIAKLRKRQSSKVSKEDHSPSKIYNLKFIISHHELGLFHPYPSQVTDIKQIPQAWSLSSFIKAGKPNNIVQKLSIIGKYCLIRLIHRQLHRFTITHIVPSAWMESMVRARHPKADIETVPHFVHIAREEDKKS